MSELSSYPTGSIYLLGNPSMPGLYKIGYTTRPIGNRIRELSRSTSVPSPFHCILEIKTAMPSVVECYLHENLSISRASTSREFFSFPTDKAAASKVMELISACDDYQPCCCESLVIPAQSAAPESVTGTNKSNGEEVAAKSNSNFWEAIGYGVS